MGNRWKEIWNKNKEFTLSDMDGEEFDVYSRLKGLDGFDVSVEDAEAYFRRFYDMTIKMWEHIQSEETIHSVYEVGCGSGPNLYLLQNRGMRVGGIDFSASLSDIARQIVKESDSIRTDEAINLDTDEKYDVVFSDGVFAYFSDETYGLKVLEKMYEKASKVVMVSEEFDKSMKQECEDYRRKMLEGYEERYRGLDKVFYEKDMFRRFAEERQCRIEFENVENEYYWNSRFLFHCIIYKG